MAYVPPKFKDKNGKAYEGKKAWEKGLNKFSDMGVLAIPNRPFSGKPVKIIAGKNPPDGDYRKPLTGSELKLLRKVVPGLSILVVDSMPELSDPRLELILREYYHMGDSRIQTLTWAQIFDACKRYLATQQKGKGFKQEKDVVIKEDEEWPDDLFTLVVIVQKYAVTSLTLRRAIKDGRLTSYRPKYCSKNHPHKVSESQVASNWPVRSG